MGPCSSAKLLFFMSNKSIKTPCVGLCSTVYGDTVCRGCKRFHHEVINWNGYDDAQKRAVWLRLEQLLVQVMMAKLSNWSSAPSVLSSSSRNIAGLTS